MLAALLLVAQNPCGTAKTIPQSEYVKIIYETALKYNAAFVNMYGLWGSYAAAVASGYMTADPTHPAQAGHDNYYSVVAAALSA